MCAHQQYIYEIGQTAFGLSLPQIQGCISAIYPSFSLALKSMIDDILTLRSQETYSN